MLVCISFAGGYENREKEKKEEKNCMYGANCKYYEQFSSLIIIIEHGKVKE
jgi:hypothetical protein